ncbi:hypothetical protein AVEN_138647-1 [Araneus ventricosus]|uniref:Uncharacterized protein n=1 Tax=Araneus ventricosus TaxID=182803 RepID=A0A4Y2E517_ARAVE|nr:hypothetical protein AVEN_138647-1 [Araneus ventricosus]
MEWKTNQPNITDVSEASACFSKVFGPCPTESILVLNSLLQQFFDDSINIINATAMETGDVDEKTKGIVNMCLNRAGSDLTSSCFKDFHSIVKEILDKGQSTIDIDVTDEGVECLAEILSVCSLKARLILMRLILEYKGVLLNISFMPQTDQINIMKLISGEEQNVIRHCLSQLNPSTVDDCLPGLMYVLNEVYENNIPNLNRIPVRITAASCLKDSFANCSADSRLFLTELVHRYTNVFVDLLFFISKDSIDRHLLNIANECIATIPASLLNGCIKDLIIVTEKLSSGLYPLSQLDVELKERKSNCVNDLVNRCSRYHRILIDQLMRKLTRSLINTDMFDILHPLNIYSGAHQHTFTDRQLIQQCFDTINEDYLNWCVPGLYEIIRSLTESNFPISVIALKPIEGSCLDMAFAECSYKSRILIKDMLYDFAYLFVNISLHGAPQGQTGELGPPLDAIQECISSVNSTGSDSCVLGIIASLHKVFIEKVENPQPIVYV